eukprot:SAG22_NODE_7891_length_700_cov_0.798669_1_plen_109_part_10
MFSGERPAFGFGSRAHFGLQLSLGLGPQQAGPESGGQRPPTRLTVFIGGTRQPRLAEWRAGGEDTVKAVALKAVREHLGVTEEPSVSAVVQMDDAIAQYTVGHKKRTTG